MGIILSAGASTRIACYRNILAAGLASGRHGVSDTVLSDLRAHDLARVADTRRASVAVGAIVAGVDDARVAGARRVREGRKPLPMKASSGEREDQRALFAKASTASAQIDLIPHVYMTDARSCLSDGRTFPKR